MSSLLQLSLRLVFRDLSRNTNIVVGTMPTQFLMQSQCRMLGGNKTKIKKINASPVRARYDHNRLYKFATHMSSSSSSLSSLPKKMAGKVFAITGGASGIGLAAAKLLVERGAKVSIADVSSKLNEAAVEIAQHAGLPQDECVLARSVDVRELSQIQAWLKATVEAFGRLDGAVNSAGVFDYPKAATGQTAALWHQERGIDQWNHVIGVNLTGTANCCHVELEYMTSEAAKAENWGRSIVNMTSVAGFRARGGSPACVFFGPCRRRRLSDRGRERK